MFITCQECNTTFRLDERLLKSTGSKVRCSQCRYTFVATPPSARPMALAAAKVPVFEALAEEVRGPAVSEEPEDQSLEGIDLAELDSILESEAANSAPEAKKRTQAELEVDLPLDDEEELDEIDLDFDFDAALEAEDKDKQEQAPRAAAGVEPSDELSLDMDFEIHDDTLIIKKEELEGFELATLTLEEEPVKKPEKAPVKAASLSEPSLEDDLDMAF
ncbi:MAG: zinc-ribbon domain-containing protein, partial [Desulfatitalea sp.]|nr:zinc-ribbon domain-containing protein [Desulfatitalea sp.]